MDTRHQEELPACDFRTESVTPRIYVCSHVRVRTVDGLVTSEVCQICSVRRLPSGPLLHSTVGSQRRSPGVISQAWSLTQAMTAFVADGCRTLSAEEYQARLTVCDGCDRRRGNRCMECGCRLSMKARGRAFHCPLNKWPSLSQPVVSSEVPVVSNVEPEQEEPHS